MEITAFQNRLDFLYEHLDMLEGAMAAWAPLNRALSDEGSAAGAICDLLALLERAVGGVPYEALHLIAHMPDLFAKHVELRGDLDFDLIKRELIDCSAVRRLAASEVGQRRETEKRGRRALTLFDETFDEELKSATIMLVVFFTLPPGPFRQMMPMMDVLAGEYYRYVNVGKLCVGLNNQIPQRYDIETTPTLLLFKGGRVVERKLGSVGKAIAQQMMDAYL